MRAARGSLTSAIKHGPMQAACGPEISRDSAAGEPRRYCGFHAAGPPSYRSHRDCGRTSSLLPRKRRSIRLEFQFGADDQWAGPCCNRLSRGTEGSRHGIPASNVARTANAALSDCIDFRRCIAQRVVVWAVRQRSDDELRPLDVAMTPHMALARHEPHAAPEPSCGHAARATHQGPPPRQRQRDAQRGLPPRDGRAARQRFSRRRATPPRSTQIGTRTAPAASSAWRVRWVAARPTKAAAVSRRR